MDWTSYVVEHIHEIHLAAEVAEKLIHYLRHHHNVSHEKHLKKIKEKHLVESNHVTPEQAKKLVKAWNSRIKWYIFVRKTFSKIWIEAVIYINYNLVPTINLYLFFITIASLTTLIVFNLHFLQA